MRMLTTAVAARGADARRGRGARAGQGRDADQLHALGDARAILRRRRAGHLQGRRHRPRNPPALRRPAERGVHRHRPRAVRRRQCGRLHPGARERRAGRRHDGGRAGYAVLGHHAEEGQIHEPEPAQGQEDLLVPEQREGPARAAADQGRPHAQRHRIRQRRARRRSADARRRTGRRRVRLSLRPGADARHARLSRPT